MGQIYTHVLVDTSVENQKSTKWPGPPNKLVAHVYCWVRLMVHGRYISWSNNMNADR